MYPLNRRNWSAPAPAPAIVRNAVYVPCLAQFDPGQLWLSK